MNKTKQELIEMRIYKYLFYIRDNEIAAFDSKFEYQEREGNKFQPFTPDFWEWWRKTYSFLPDRFQIDFCFLVDSNPRDFYLPEEYKKVAKTSWRKTSIIKFIETLAPQKIIVLENGIAINSFSSKDRVPKLYLTRYNIPDTEITEADQENASDIDLNETKEGNEKVSSVKESNLHKDFRTNPLPEKIRREISKK